MNVWECFACDLNSLDDSNPSECACATSHGTHMNVWECQVSMVGNAKYSVAKTHRMPYVAGHNPQISHYLQGSFAENDL